MTAAAVAVLPAQTHSVHVSFMHGQLSWGVIIISHIMKFLLPGTCRHASPSTAMTGAILMALSIFGLLAEDIVEKQSIPFDVPLLQLLHAHANPALDDLMLLLSWLGSAAILLPVAIGVFAVLGKGAAGGRPPIGRSPPEARQCSTSLESIFSSVIVQGCGHRSIPNSRSAFRAGTPCKPWRCAWRHGCSGAKRRRAGCLFVVGVGLSRLYLGVHYPSDVLAGWCVSFAWCSGLALVMERRWVRG